MLCITVEIEKDISNDIAKFGAKLGTKEQELVDQLKVYENDLDTIVIEKNSTSYRRQY